MIRRGTLCTTNIENLRGTRTTCHPEREVGRARGIPRIRSRSRASAGDPSRPTAARFQETPSVYAGFQPAFLTVLVRSTWERFVTPRPAGRAGVRAGRGCPKGG